MNEFDYGVAFSRNLGLISESEQGRLRHATVAIAGMGGVGGDYAISFARSGVGRFRLADFDRFELANFNRQYGATLSTLGRSKADVIAQAVLDVNPEAQVDVFTEGVTEDNLQAFISGADLVVDGIDLFAPDWHRRLISVAQQSGQPVIAAVPVGFGAGMLAFDGQSMSFDDYFDWNDRWSPERKVLQLALGFAPGGYHVRYIDPASIDLKAHKGPSSVAGCKACAAIITTHGLQAILRPETIDVAPWFTHIDLKVLRFSHRKLLGGMRNPFMRMKVRVAAKRLHIP